MKRNILKRRKMSSRQLQTRASKSYRPSKVFGRDPTASLRLEREYQKDLTALFLEYKKTVLRSFEISIGMRRLEAPALPPNLNLFLPSVDDIARIVNEAGKKVVIEHTAKAYNHGTTFASMTLKRSGHPAFKFMPDKPQGVSFAFTGPNKATYDAMLQNNLNDLTKATDEIKALIKREMLTGIEKSETTMQLYRRIRDAADLGKQKAMVIARTETMRVVNQGAKARFDEAGVRTEWLTTHDELACPACSALDGKISPEQTDGLPPAHPNCRCTVIPVAYGSEE
jgi:SPP1 gp7 family putative phage head morphogenesis protein